MSERIEEGAGRLAAGRLAGKIALVTGSTSGIGKGIALRFAREGARVLITGREGEERGEEAMEEMIAGGAPREHLAFEGAELADPAHCRALVERAVAVFGGLDILINNAGDVTRGNIDDTTVELWDWQMAVNLRAPFILTQAALPHLRARASGAGGGAATGGAAIVNIGSVNAYIGGGNLLSYSASKGGLMTFTRNVAAYLTRERIRVNLLNVGWTLTEGERRIQIADTGDENWLERAAAGRPIGRLLDPDDIARAALYFASDESAPLTGAVLDVEQQPVGR